jgi:hypothetical protein
VRNKQQGLPNVQPWARDKSINDGANYQGQQPAEQKDSRWSQPMRRWNLGQRPAKAMHGRYPNHYQQEQPSNVWSLPTGDVQAHEIVMAVLCLSTNHLPERHECKGCTHKERCGHRQWDQKEKRKKSSIEGNEKLVCQDLKP